ncbi:hypothetical protein [Sporosarcina koreensis]|uniref:hypothetical protein n=1 Tax=Sporosarcina koreensis TaxID=334735 RepID=UPI000AA7AC9D|nr:hypothetical protein [Sporosarcina koreensis]
MAWSIGQISGGIGHMTLHIGHMAQSIGHFAELIGIGAQFNDVRTAGTPLNFQKILLQHLSGNGTIIFCLLFP